MSHQTYTLEDAGLRMLVLGWHGRFIDRWTVDEISDWRDRVASGPKATNAAASAGAGKGAARGRISR
jgi:hypothetical protein